MERKSRQGFKSIIAIIIGVVLCVGTLSGCDTSAAATAIVIAQSAVNTSFELGEDLDYKGLKVQAKLENGLFKELLAEDYKISSDYNSEKVGDYTVSIFYKENENLKTEYKVHVNQAPALSLSVASPITKQVYEIGEKIDYAGLQLQKSVGADKVVDVDLADCYVSTDFDSAKPGIYQVTIMLKEDSSKKTTFSVTVLQAHVASLNIDTTAVKKTFGVGEELNFDGLVVMQIMSDSTFSVVPNGDYVAVSADYNKQKGGEYIVTVSLKSDSRIFASYTVNVKPITSELKITTPASKLNYNRNENISYDGLKISEVLNDGTEILLNADAYTITTDYNKALGGEYTVTIKLNSNDKIVTTYKVTVDKKVSSISVKQKPAKISYQIGDELNLDGLIIQKSFNDYTKEVITVADYTVDSSKFNNKLGGTYKITIKLNSQALTDYFNVTVVKNIVSCVYDGVSEPAKTLYELNEDINLRNDTVGLKLVLTYNDGTTADATSYAYMHSTNHDKTKAGKYNVTISFNLDTYPAYTPVKDFTYEYEITVREPVVKALSIAKYPTKIIYSQGEKLELDGLIVQSNFSNGTFTAIDNSEYKVEQSFDSATIGTHIIKILYNNDDKIFVEFSVVVDPKTSPITFEQNISDNMQILGSKYTFDFTAKDSKGEIINNVKASIDGNATIELAWGDSEKNSYTIQLNNNTSAYKIVFVVTDSDENVVARVFNITHPPVKKGDRIGEVTFSVDAFTIGHGYIVAPTAIDIYEGENAVYSLARAIRYSGYCFTYTGSIERGFYIQRIISGSSHTISNCACKELNGIIPILNPKALLIFVNPPKGITDNFGELDTDDYTQGSLGEFDLSSSAGWMYAVNNAFPNVGFSDCYPISGNVIRAQFTIAYGADIGSWGGGYFEEVDRDALTALIATINMQTVDIKIKCAEQYNTAMSIVAQIGVSQVDLNNAYEALKIVFDSAVK